VHAKLGELTGPVASFVGLTAPRGPRVPTPVRLALESVLPPELATHGEPQPNCHPESPSALGATRALLVDRPTACDGCNCSATSLHGSPGAHPEEDKVGAVPAPSVRPRRNAGGVRSSTPSPSSGPRSPSANSTRVVGGLGGAHPVG
jgi:hypothetical protein